MPDSTTREPSSTTMKSAMRTVLNRCETRMVMRPSAAGLPRSTRAAAARRRRVTLEQGVLGLGVERRRRLVEHEEQRTLAHESAGERELLPLAEADLHALGPGGAELRLEARGELLDDVARAGPLDGRRHRRRVVEPRQVADADGVARPELEPEEVLKRAGEPRTPRIRRHARELDAVDQDAPAGRLIQAAQELHQRRLAGAVLPHDGDHRARLEMQVHVVEHEALGAGIGEGHVLEADAFLRVARARARRRPATSAAA